MEAAATPLVRVAAICGSLRKASFNRGLVRSAIQLCESGSVKGMHIEYVDIEALPFVNTDLEDCGKYPPAVEAFRQKILQADGVLFASPEYNYSMTAHEVLRLGKAVIDWETQMSRG